MARARQNSGINRPSGTTKLIISAALGAAFFLIVPTSPGVHVVLSWNVFCLSQLILIWWPMLQLSSKTIRSQAQHQDGSRAYIFVVSLLAALVSLFSVIQMILSAKEDELYKTINLTSGIACMVLSWILIHTIFSVRYAHLYYARDPSKKDKHAGGLDFPSHPEKDNPDWPDFMDFVYFSFTIGMTFQVSDVEITDKRIRKIVLMHSLFSFAFNAAIIALSVNIISGLIGN